MQPVHPSPFRHGVRQQRQYDIHGIEHDAPRAHFLGFGPQRRQHPVEIEIPRMDQVGHRQDVHEKQLFPPQLRKFPAEAFGIGDDALRCLLKSDEDTRLLAILRAMYQELQREYGLARAGSARQQRRAAAEQTAAGDFIETDDAGRRFGGRFQGGANVRISYYFRKKHNSSTAMAAFNNYPASRLYLIQPFIAATRP